MRKPNYSEFATLPAWTQPVWSGGKLLNEADPFKWSGEKAPPAIGDKVKTYVNKLGSGTVTAYFVEYGWLGVIISLDKPPAWYTKQNKGNPPGHFFGIDLAPRTINIAKETA